MRLDTYLSDEGLTSEQFARRAGIGHKQTVHYYRHGLRFPSPENIARIERATGGKVTAADFVEHVRERRAAKAEAATSQPAAA